MTTEKCCGTCGYYIQYESWHAWQQGGCSWVDNIELPWFIDDNCNCVVKNKDGKNCKVWLNKNTVN